MQLFWASGFGPELVTSVPVWSLERLFLVFSTAGGGFAGTMEYAFPGVVVAAVVIGIVALAWRDGRRATLVVGPVLVTMGAAIAGRYPFQGRVVMFLIPFLLILAVLGIDAVARLVSSRPWIAAAPWVLLFPAAQATLAYPVPQYFEHLRPVLEHVAQNTRVGDAVWVYYGAGSAFRYYQHRIDLAGQVSVCDRGDPRGQLVQIDTARGQRRVWVVIAHFGAESGVNERIPLLAYLDRIGTRLAAYGEYADTASPGAAFALLYDLSSARKLATASAETFEVLPSTGTKWSCYGTMTPTRRDCRERPRP